MEHAFALRACEVAETVTHLSEVLCHRSDDDCEQSQRGTPAAARAGCSPPSGRFRTSVEPGPAPGTFRVRRHAPAETSTSILIPFRDEPRLLRTCVDSVMATTTDHDVEIVLIDNGSSDPETLTLIERLADRSDVRGTARHAAVQLAAAQ